MENISLKKAYAITDHFMKMYANWINANCFIKDKDKWTSSVSNESFTDNELLLKFKELHK